MKIWALKVPTDSIFLQCLRECDSQPGLRLSHYGCVFYRRGGVGYCRPQTPRQSDWFSSLDLCGISHSGGLAGTAGSLRRCWERESLEWAGFFSFLVLRPLRFPPVLTWLRFYNSPERVTSSRVEIPGFFFSFSFPLLFFLFYWKGGVGAAYCGTFVRQPVAEAGPTSDLWQHLQDAKPLCMLLIIQRALAGLEIEKRWSGGVWWGFMESVRGFTLMATRVNILSDRGISAAQGFQAGSWPQLVFAPSECCFCDSTWSKRFSPSLKLICEWSKCFVT